ncbi:MATE family efflux transporter [Bacteroides coprosuis]|uniref:MATE family efflux transporter n=1 Tax=Bacteroides coprosuis TaxID=151276 RepID=UPI001D7CBCF5|nr:MATE family efflux transporter [Bacteroides coprosuis]HJD92371.1 MATE family efflux transporter [Bacteroides coprosuis]
MSDFLNKYKEHYKVLLYLGIPIIIGQLGVIVLGFADTLMISWHSKDELAAVGFVNNVFNLPIIFGTGFSYGLTPVVGRLFGQKKFLEVGQSLKASLVSNFMVGLLITAIMGIVYLNVEHLGQPIDLMPLIKPYFIILLCSLPFVVLFNAFKQFADGITDTRMPMWLLIGGNSLNIIGNYALIYGKFGCPELGLMGAGLSTLFSRILMVLVFAYIFFFANRYDQYREGFFRLPLTQKFVGHLNKLGWPVGIQMGLETASFSLSAVMVGWLGHDALAAHQIVITVSTATFMVYYGMGAAVAVRVSNYKSNNDIFNIKRTASAGFHLTLVIAIFLSSIVFSLRHNFVDWFGQSGNMEINAMILLIMFPLVLYQFGDALQINYANALRGIADVKPMMVIAFFSYFVVSLPLGYVFGFICDWGILGIWMALPVGLTTAGLLLWGRFQRKTKQ